MASLFHHLPRLAKALLFVFCVSWFVDGHAAILPGQDAEWFLPSHMDMDKFFNMNLAMVGSAVTVVQIIFESSVTKDGHSCLVDAAQINIKVGPDTYVSWNRVYWCADGYMGATPPMDYSNKDVWLMLMVVGMSLLFGLGFIAGQQR